MEKMYLVSESELRDLIYNTLTLTMLERNGVDNWDWYCEGRSAIICDYFPDATEEELDELDFGDCVDILLNDYCEVER